MKRTMRSIGCDLRKERLLGAGTFADEVHRRIEIDVGTVTLHRSFDTVLNQRWVSVLSFGADRIRRLADAAAAVYQVS